MASLDKRKGKWRARVYVDGQRSSATFYTKAEAAAWALRREAELTKGTFPSRTVAAAFQKYAEDVSPTKRGKRWEVLRLNRLGKDPDLGGLRMSTLNATHIAEWRDCRLKKVSGSTVSREMALLRSVFRIARMEWHWIGSDPMQDVKRPSKPRARRRRITQDEIDRIRLALGYPKDKAPQNLTQRVAMAFLFAIETGMRAGEILTLEWPAIHLKERFVHLDKTKNGDDRDVPLTRYAARLLKLLPANETPAFGLETGTRDALFRRARDAAKIGDLHFHDTRAEAIWRLSKKLDVLQLARMVGHRDLKSLQSYYAEPASETAKLLG